MLNRDLYQNTPNPLTKFVYPVYGQLFTARSVDLACAFMSLMVLHLRYYDSGQTLLTGDALEAMFIQSDRTKRQYHNIIAKLVSKGLLSELPARYKSTRVLIPTDLGWTVFNDSFCVVLGKHMSGAEQKRRIYTEVNQKYAGEALTAVRMAEVLGWDRAKLCYRRADYR